MNKKYMDFVPQGKKRSPKVKTEGAVLRESAELSEFEVNEIFEARDTRLRAGVTTRPVAKKTPRAENYRERFVKTEVDKRPLSVQKEQKELLEVKAKKIPRVPVIGKKAKRQEKADATQNVVGAKGVGVTRASVNIKSAKEVRANESAKSMGEARTNVGMKNTSVVTENKKTMKIPRSPFVNIEKVQKRPLSKSIYQERVDVPSEVPSGPVTIIDKPEKDSKVGLVVTIIITIILGAAAGTVAFLLLPK